MKHRRLTLGVMMVIGALLLVSCGTDLDDVASLSSIEDAQPVERASDEADADAVLDNEAIMIAFTECMREHGVEVLDPVVDSEGNVGKPEYVGGSGYDKEQDGEAWEACAELLEGFTFEEKRVEVSEQVDALIPLAACMRNKGYDVDDPTAESLDQWWTDMKMSMDWDDPETTADYEDCSGERVGEGSGK